MVKLVEVFGEWTPRVRGASQAGRYAAEYEVVRRPNAKPVTEEDLHMYVQRLREKYPDAGFRVRRWKDYFVIDKPSRKKDGTFASDRIPIYIDLGNQRFFVPIWYIKNRKKLASFVVMRVLGALGVAKVRYVRMSSRRVSG